MSLIFVLLYFHRKKCDVLKFPDVFQRKRKKIIYVIKRTVGGMFSLEKKYICKSYILSDSSTSADEVAI